MKKHVDGEKIALIIVVIIIIGVVISLAFAIFKSNTWFRDNSSEEENITNPQNNNNNENTQKGGDNKGTDSPNTPTVPPTQEQVDEVNVEPPKVAPPAPQPKQEEVIASYKTAIYDKEAGRIHNISLAISKLNQTIIKANAEFSFNYTVGAMGKEQGYEKALGFDSKGKKIQIYGGGMCQLSSTLYNTALIANLQVTERHPHSRRVYYVPKDKDATIFYPSLDLKFLNNTDGDIRIDASNTDSDVTINLVKLK